MAYDGGPSSTPLGGLLLGLLTIGAIMLLMWAVVEGPLAPLH